MKDNIEMAKAYTDWNVKENCFAKDMTLRDYFASQIMTWFLNKLDEESIVDDPALLRQFSADHAYKMADAMLKERSK